MLSWAFKHPKLAIIAILLVISTVGGSVGYVMVTISRLETKVARLETAISEKNSEIKSLVASVGVQNTAVQEWKAKAQGRLETAHKAQREAQEARDRSNQLLGKLEDMDAQTCEEGIELIDRALGL